MKYRFALGIFLSISVGFLPACALFSPRSDLHTARYEQKLARTNEALNRILRRLESLDRRLLQYESRIQSLEAALVSVTETTVASAAPATSALPEPQTPPPPPAAPRPEPQASTPSPTTLPPKPPPAKILKPELSYEEALKAFKKKDLSKSYMLFENFVQRYPDHPLADKALKWIDYIQSLQAAPDPEAPATLFGRAVDAYNQKQFEKAEGLFQQFINQYARHHLAVKANKWIAYIRKKAPEPKNGKDAAGAKALYEQARAVYLQHNTESARNLFNDFLKTYPNHYLSDNALYWIGECHYTEKAFQDAAHTFLKVVEQYPEGNKAPAALLKAGYSYLAMNDFENAYYHLQKVRELYPDSRERRIAERKMTEVEKRMPRRPPPARIENTSA